MKKYLFKMVFTTISFLCVNITNAQKVFTVGDEFDSDIRVTKLYQKFRKSKTKKEASELVYRKEFFSKKSSYIKIYFENFDLAPGDYLKLTGANTKESIIYGGKGKIVDEKMTMISNFWSQILFDEKVVLELYSTGSAVNYNGFEIKKVAYGYSEEKIMKKLVGQESICGSDNKERIACYKGTEMFEKAKAVCRLFIGGSSLCTGWLLGEEGHLMTNNHCIGSSSSASNTDFVFNYQYDNCSGTTLANKDVVASSAAFIKTNSQLDYTLVKLPVNPTNTYGYLSLSSIAPSVGDRIYIPQHPGGRRKEISVKTDTDGTPDGFSSVYASTSGSGQQVKYYADTEGGSSGSPVINYTTNLVISIHNTGGCPNGSYGRCDNLITDIGSDMPSKGVGGGTPPPPTQTCTKVISSYPYTESFEINDGWKQLSNDDGDWLRDDNGTPSRNTGPSSGDDGDFYMFLEASSNSSAGQIGSNATAELLSPCFNLKEVVNPRFSFSAHMYGDKIGSLKLLGSTDGINWKSLWEKSGNKGNKWLKEEVSLTNYLGEEAFRLKFIGTTGDGWTSDIAIDNIVLATDKPGGDETSVTLTIKFDNYPKETSWVINDDKGNLMASGGAYGDQKGGTEIKVSNDLIKGCYDLIIKDSYGDGICCKYGSGSYTLIDDKSGAILASGAKFSSSETTSFCIGEDSYEGAVENFDFSGEIINDLMIYPNPVQKTLRFKIPERKVKGKYKILNAAGGVIMEGQLQEIIPLNGVYEGIYILEVETDKANYTKTFIKIK
ncbi:trypsin-like peptidase domain-containing protein [Tenacibaculum sp. C7A-26P2]|uniref:trypsin-like peptidase domain-containing protein n=1 Tax=Tenacibaculum sp. C7A-26P2 TaxID=3447504 RepID=UPI003F839FB8